MKKLLMIKGSSWVGRFYPQSNIHISLYLNKQKIKRSLIYNKSDAQLLSDTPITFSQPNLPDTFLVSIKCPSHDDALIVGSTCHVFQHRLVFFILVRIRVGFDQGNVRVYQTSSPMMGKVLGRRAVTRGNSGQSSESKMVIWVK